MTLKERVMQAVQCEWPWLKGQWHLCPLHSCPFQILHRFKSIIKQCTEHKYHSSSLLRIALFWNLTLYAPPPPPSKKWVDRR